MVAVLVLVGVNRAVIQYLAAVAQELHQVFLYMVVMDLKHLQEEQQLQDFFLLVVADVMLLLDQMVGRGSFKLLLQK